MKVLVTGGAGYIGSGTVERLLEEGYETIVFDNLERGHRNAVDGRAAFIRGDLRDRESIARAMLDTKPDAVVHFAAYALVGESMSEPERYFGNNVAGGINLVDAMLKARVGKIVFSSTCATYGEPDTDRIAEDTVQRPTNPYGDSKLMLEKILAWHHRAHRLEYVVLRYFNAAGAFGKCGEDHDPETHLIPNVLDVALRRADAVRIFGADYGTPDGTCVRDYVHVWDLARAHVMALAGHRHCCALNLGTGRGYSVLQVVETARAVTGRPIPTATCPRRRGDPPRLVADCAKAGAALGWVPERSDLEQIVESAWMWRLEHPDGYRQGCGTGNARK